MNEQKNIPVHKVDLSKAPLVYPTSNKDYFGKYCIDLFPEDLPTVASFETEYDAHKWLIDKFGGSIHGEWFPSLYREEHTTCIGCHGYKPLKSFKGSPYCKECMFKIKALSQPYPTR